MKREGQLRRIVLSPLFSLLLLGGCSNLVLFEPGGPIGDAERTLIVTAFLLMLIVVIPVLVMTLWFPLKYRDSNTKAIYTPKWAYSGRLDFAVWMVPIAIIMVLGYLTWTETHRLDPYRPLKPDVKPINIQAVALDWKWLFIYPDFNIAAVNELVVPVEIPLSFRITSDTVMNSFFIPQLGSQMYAMAGMESRLHLLADKAGVYFGQTQQFSGSGYAYMQFRAKAVSQSEFQGWLQEVGQSADKLDPARFQVLQKPSIAAPVTYFSTVEPGLFDQIIRQYMPTSMKPAALKGYQAAWQ